MRKLSVFKCLFIKSKLLIYSSSLSIFLTSSGFSSELTRITPEEAGYDSSKLAKITEQADSVYEAGLIPNYVIALAKDGKIFFSASRGNRILGTDDPVGLNTLYPMASMSKPIASSAIFKLIEQGKLTLESELREFYPDFETMFVAQNGDLNAQFEESERAITILDLITHTAGIEYRSAIGGTTDVADLYEELGLIDACMTAAENMELLSQIPLIAQPGELWNYSVSIDILGAVVEVISGEPLGEFVRKNIFEPIGITDSAWRHSDSRIASHFATLYNPPPLGVPAIGKDGGDSVDWQLSESTRYSACPVGTQVRTFDMGGSGLVGNAVDYLIYASMMAGYGEFLGTRVLKSESVEAQFTKHASAAERVMGNDLRNFGAGFGIQLLDASEEEVDYYSWGGSNNTGFFIDPDGTVGVQLSSCYRCRQALIPNIEQIVDEARIDRNQ